MVTPSNSSEDFSAHFATAELNNAPQQEEEGLQPDLNHELDTNIEQVEILLDHGAIPTIRELIRAINYNKPTELLRKLVQRVADVNEKDKFGRSPLYVALQIPNFEAANILLDHGAISRANDLTRAIYSETATELFHRLVQRVEDVNEKDECNRSSLYFALNSNKFEAVKVLLENEADTDLVHPSIRPSHEITNLLEFYRTSREVVRNLNSVLRLFILKIQNNL